MVGADGQVADWIREENAIPFVLSIAEMVQYAFDELDADALDFAALARGETRTYEMSGLAGQATISLAHEVGSSVVDAIVTLPTDYERALSAVIAILQGYSLNGPPRWMSDGVFSPSTK
jgi:hypothetical protein